MPHHRRIVIHLRHGTTPRAPMRQAAEMARLLGIGMLGVLIEDDALRGLAALPFARELRLPAHRWQAIDPHHLAAEFQHEAAATRRLLDAIARDTGVTCEFEVCRGDAAGLFAPEDIVALPGPDRSADALTQAFPRAWQSVTQSAASVLLMPHGAVRRHGSVVLLCLGGGLHGVRTGAHIARISNEDLVILAAPTMRDAVMQVVNSTGVPDDRIMWHDLGQVSAPAMRFALSDHQERLLVTDRASLSVELETMLSRLAADRGTPVLLVGPEAIS